MKNYKQLILITIVSGLLVNPLFAIAVKENTAQVSDQKRQKYISIAKKVGAVIGPLALLASGSGGVYYLYLRRKWALEDALLKAIHEGNFDVAVDMLNHGIRIPKDKLWCEGSIIQEAIVNGAYLNKDISHQNYLKGITKILGIMKDEINNPDEFGVTPLFATMHRIQAAVVTFSGSVRDQRIKRLFDVMDILFAHGVDENSCGPMWSCTTPVPGGTLLHAAAAIPTKQNHEDFSAIRQRIIDKIHTYGINSNVRDTQGRLYTEIPVVEQKEEGFPLSSFF